MVVDMGIRLFSTVWGFWLSGGMGDELACIWRHVLRLWHVAMLPGLPELACNLKAFEARPVSHMACARRELVLPVE